MARQALEGDEPHYHQRPWEEVVAHSVGDGPRFHRARFFARLRARLPPPFRRFFPDARCAPPPLQLPLPPPPPPPPLFDSPTTSLGEIFEELFEKQDDGPLPSVRNI